MSFTSLWPVMVINASEPFIMDGSVAIPSSYYPIPLFAADPNGVAHGMAVRVGEGSFLGQNSPLIETPQAHGMPVIPSIGLAISGTDTGGGAWAADVGQYQSPDGTYLYFFFDSAAGNFSSSVEYFFTWIAFGFM